MQLPIAAHQGPRPIRPIDFMASCGTKWRSMAGGEAFLKWLRTDPRPESKTKSEGSMEIRYTLTLEDYCEGNRVRAVSTTSGRKLKYYVFVRFGLLIGVLSFLAVIGLSAIRPLQTDSRLAVMSNGAIGVLIWVGIVCMISPFTYRSRIKRSFREQKLPCEVSLLAMDSGVTITQADGTSEGRFNWSAIERGAETQRMFVLFPNVRQFVAIPKRVMTPEQQVEFRNLVAGTSPVLPLQLCLLSR